MALQTGLLTRTGVTGTYHKILQVRLDYETTQVEGEQPVTTCTSRTDVATYLDADARLTGAKHLEINVINLPIDLRSALYTELKNTTNFSGASDV